MPNVLNIILDVTDRSDNVADDRKEQERAALHSAIWSIADDLRGAVMGWDFKAYVLGAMFYRYISENITRCANINEWATGDMDFSYAELSDEVAAKGRSDLIHTKGFYIAPSELFENIHKRARDEHNLNEKLERILRNIESSAIGTPCQTDFEGLFKDFDVNSDRLGATVIERNQRLIKVLDGVASMKLGDYKDNTIDAFGDAYEYLMRMYAANAGKSGGEFYTPQEVSELLTYIAIAGKTEVNKVYDIFIPSLIQSHTA